MKLILFFIIIIQAIIYKKIYKKDLKIIFLVSIAFLFLPVILKQNFTLNNIYLFVFLGLILNLFEIINNKKIKISLYILIIFSYIFLTLFSNQIINSNFKIDYQKIFFIDNASSQTINRFQDSALYLPNKIRNILYSNVNIFISSIFRVFYFITFDKILSFLGLTTIYLLIKSHTKKSFYLYFLLFIIIFFSTLHRDPNTQNIFLYISIPIYTHIINNIKKIDYKIFSVSLLFTLIYYLI